MNSSDQFEAIVREHYEALFRFAMSLTRMESDARDLTQQTFYIWATKGHQLRDFSKVKIWLFTTLHRLFLGAWRRQNGMIHHDLETVAEELPTLDPICANQVDCSQVLLALARVDETYQAAVALFYLEDYSYREIALILEVPIGTVKSRIARGLGQLRGILLRDDTPVDSRREHSSSPQAADGPVVSIRKMLSPLLSQSMPAKAVPGDDSGEWSSRSVVLGKHPLPCEL